MVSRDRDISAALVFSSRASTPVIRLTCASHDAPPKVGESTIAETTPRPVAATAAANCARLAATGPATAARSSVTAPYDSMKTSSTSASRTRARSVASAGCDAAIAVASRAASPPAGPAASR